MLEWKALEFSALSPEEIHDLYQLRGQVFVVEQNCVYLDQDGRDLSAWHLLCRDSETGNLAAYARIMLPPEGEKVVHFGRVAVAEAYRGIGLGKELLGKIMQFVNARDLPLGASVEISAQAHLVKFYESSGFRCVGESYLEDEIPHIRMHASAKVARYPLRSLQNAALFRPSDEFDATSTAEASEPEAPRFG